MLLEEFEIVLGLLNGNQDKEDKLQDQYQMMIGEDGIGRK